MVYMLNNKQIRIPDSAIEHTMKTLNVSKEEAVQTWLEDEGYLENEEQEQLCKKAKDTRITATIHQAKSAPNSTTKKTPRKRVKKEDPTKENIIAEIAKFLPTLGAEDVQIANVSKLITFKIGKDTYKFDLIRQRAVKN